MTTPVDTIHLTLPLPPNRGNARWHWRVELRKKQEYWHWLNLYRATERFPRGWGGPTPEVVRVRAKLYVWNRMDDDNAMARLKWVMDWLEAWDYIGDDGAGVEWEGLPEQAIDRKNQRVEITLEAA